MNTTTKQQKKSKASHNARNNPPPYFEREFKDIEERAINWIWKGKLATKINVIGGAPGLGKSQLAISIIATLTNGSKWPDGTKCKKGRAVIITSEDDAEDTLKPRLLAAGANIERVSIFDAVRDDDGNPKPWSLEHIDQLKELVRRKSDIRLIIINPITAYLGKNSDSHNTTDVRGQLAPLQELASENNICILLITHLNKSKGMSAGDRFTGSTAWLAVARGAWLVAKHPDDDSTRVFLPVKNNLGKDNKGYEFSLEEAITKKGTGTCRAVWGKQTDMKSDEVLAGKKKSTNIGEKERAMQFIENVLQNGTIPSEKLPR